MQGNLTQDRLPSLLQSLGHERESGVLQVSRDDVNKRIFFGRGSMVFARSSLHEDRLGELLVRKRVLSRANLALASNRMRAQQKKLGATLVALGLMTERQMRARLEEQVRNIIHSLFTWNEGWFRFQPKESDAPSEIQLDLPTVPMILEGTRLMASADVRAAVGDLHRIVSNSKDPRVVQHYANLTPEEGFVLSRVDGSASFADIVSISPLEEVDTLRCIYGLLSSGFIEIGKKARQVTPSVRRRAPIDSYQPTPPRRAETAEPKNAQLSPEERWVQDEIESKHASLATGTFYEWLEVRRTADAREIKKAFARLIKKYHPDRHRSQFLESMGGKLEEIVIKVTHAHDTLGDPQSRRRYDNSMRTEAPRGEGIVASAKPTPSEPKPPDIREKTADRYYREAKKYFVHRDYHETVELMQEAVELDPSKIRYHCLLAQAMARNPKWRKSAEEHFKTALEMDRFDTESLVGLAELYESVGLNRRAHALYSDAVEVNPENSVLRLKAKSCE